MDWCPVEWPIKPQANTLVELQQQQSGKKATRAGLVGILVLITMMSVVFSYALWLKEIDLPKSLDQTKAFFVQTITGEVPVVLAVDGKTKMIKSKAETVQELLDQQGIKVSPQDKVVPALTALLQKDMQIKIVRVEMKQQQIERAIPFNTKRYPNQELPRGFARQINAGKEGVERQDWQIRFEDGQEVAKTCVAKVVVSEPVDQIIQYGTLTNLSRGAQNFRFSHSLDMLATGYSYTGYNTASGEAPRPGVAAVDPKVIPLGTRLYIEGYGRATALDTGGLIKGNRIDLFYPSEGEAIQWGVRTARVYVLE